MPVPVLPPTRSPPVAAATDMGQGAALPPRCNGAAAAAATATAIGKVSIGWTWRKAARTAGSTTAVHTVSDRLEVRRGQETAAAEAEMETPVMAGACSHVVGRNHT